MVQTVDNLRMSSQVELCKSERNDEYLESTPTKILNTIINIIKRSLKKDFHEGKQINLGELENIELTTPLLDFKCDVVLEDNFSDFNETVSTEGHLDVNILKDNFPDDDPVENIFKVGIQSLYAIATLKNYLEANVIEKIKILKYVLNVIKDQDPSEVFENANQIANGRTLEVQKELLSEDKELHSSGTSSNDDKDNLPKFEYSLYQLAIIEALVDEPIIWEAKKVKTSKVLEEDLVNWNSNSLITKNYIPNSDPNIWKPMPVLKTERQESKNVFKLLNEEDLIIYQEHTFQYEEELIRLAKEMVLI